MGWFRGEVAKAQAGRFVTADTIQVPPTEVKPPPTDRQLLEAIYAEVQALRVLQNATPQVVK
jgi:hypothetical protein